VPAPSSWQTWLVLGQGRAPGHTAGQRCDLLIRPVKIAGVGGPGAQQDGEADHADDPIPERGGGDVL
jgi:hypothetical protein